MRKRIGNANNERNVFIAPEYFADAPKERLTDLRFSAINLSY